MVLENKLLKSVIRVRKIFEEYIISKVEDYFDPIYPDRSYWI